MRDSLTGHIAADLRVAVRRARLPLLLLALLCLAQLARLFFGVSLYDESYYFTQALRLSQGDRLFTDIWDVTQTQGIFLAPLYGLYCAVFGTDGLLLFGRLLFFALSLLTAAWLYEALRTEIDRRAAALIAVCLMTFAPFSLYSVSYNDLAYSLCLLGCLLFWCGLRDVVAGRLARSRGRMLAAGLAFALLAAAYPTMAVILPALALALALVARRAVPGRALRCVGWVALGMGAVAAGLICYILLGCGLDAFRTSLEQIVASPASAANMSFEERLSTILRTADYLIPTGGRRRLLLILLAVCGLAMPLGRWIDAARARFGRRLTDAALGLLCLAAGASALLTTNLDWLCVAVGVLLCVLAGRYRPWLTLSAYAVWMALSTALALQMESRSLLLCALAGFYALPLPWLWLSLAREQRRAARTSLWLLAIPAVLLTLGVTFASSGGLLQGRYALLGAALWNLTALSRIVRALPTRTPRKVGPLFARLAALLTAACFLLAECLYAFGDEPPLGLRARVTSGPAAGLYTTAERAQTLERMAADVRATPGDSLLCLECFSYGYGLDATKRAFTPNTWVCSVYEGARSWSNVLDYCRARGDEPDVILYWEPAAYQNVADPDYALHQWIAEEYTLSVDRGAYRIYVRSAE